MHNVCNKQDSHNYLSELVGGGLEDAAGIKSGRPRGRGGQCKCYTGFTQVSLRYIVPKAGRAYGKNIWKAWRPWRPMQKGINKQVFTHLSLGASAQKAGGALEERKFVKSRGHGEASLTGF
jgi:hypothetical protein